MSRATSWLAVAVLLGVFGVVVGYVVRERIRAGVGMPAYSVYNEESDGLSEAARVLGELGWTPVAVTRPIQNTNRRGLLILAEPERNPFETEADSLSDAEMLSLLRWVEEGNALLFCGRRKSHMHQLLKVLPSGKAEPTDEKIEQVQLAAGGAYLKDIDHLSADSHMTLNPQTGVSYLPLWYIKDRPGAVLLRHGKGRVVVVADPGFFTNRGLGRDDNVLFLRNVAELHARDGKVYFDEYHHGLRSTSGFWGYLGHYGQQIALLPLLIAVAVVVWHVLIRLGPAVATPRTSQTDAVDYASALARLYQRTGARRLLARTLSRGFLGALTKHLRLRRNALPAEVLAAWGEIDSGPSMERLKKLLRGVSELRKGDVSERQLLQWTREFDEFQRTAMDAR